MATAKVVRAAHQVRFWLLRRLGTGAPAHRVAHYNRVSGHESDTGGGDGRTLATVVTLDSGIVPRLGAILAKMAAFVAVAAGYGRHVAWLVAVASHVLFGSIRH